MSSIITFRSRNTFRELHRLRSARDMPSARYIRFADTIYLTARYISQKRNVKVNFRRCGNFPILSQKRFDFCPKMLYNYSV